MKKNLIFAAAVAVLLGTFYKLGISQNKRTPSAAEVPWKFYLGDGAATKFSYADQINKENVKSLKVAWIWESIDQEVLSSKQINGKPINTLYNEGTPIMVDGKIFVPTPLNQVAAIDARSGKLLWKFDPKIYEAGYPGGMGFVLRAVTYWSNGSVARIFLNTNDAYLYSLNATDGKLDTNFGNQGRVDLTKGLSRPTQRGLKYGVDSPASICRNTIIVGSSINDQIDNLDNPPGDVRGYDPLTGKMQWTFHTTPQGDEFGTETWEKNPKTGVPSWKYSGSTNVWAPMSVDEELGAVFLPVSTPSNDFYGGERLGNNLFADSIVSLKCETGERIWHFQTVHHGLWDYDPPAAPVLMDIDHNGKKIKAVAQVTKQSYTYVFNRETGEPVWPIVETSVPQTEVPGERTSPTQPIPTKPKPFDQQGVREEDLIDFTPKLREDAKKFIANYVYGPVFTPPSIKGTLVVPGLFGGASWSGAAFSPLTQKLYVPSITAPNALKLNKVDGETAYMRDLAAAGVKPPNDLPLFKPPYGRITAIDMKTGEHSWMIPIGNGYKNNPALKDVKLPDGELGLPRRIQVLATPTLLFAAQAGSQSVVGLENKGHTLLFNIGNDDPNLRALDLETGKEIARISLPGNAFGAMMTYVLDGKQYIVMPFGGANLKSGIMALALE